MKYGRIMLNNQIYNLSINSEDADELHNQHWLPPITGTVFAVALNHQSQQIAWQQAFNQPPYQQPPKTPVWFIKPHNTVIGHLQPIPYPNKVKQVYSGATLAVVIGKTTRKVSPQQATEYIAGYTLANEISLPETSFYRPAIKEKCRDGFCPIGPLINRDINLGNLTICTEINGKIVQEWHLNELVLSAPELISALSDFITLQPNDVILLGTPHQRIQIYPNDQITVHADGFRSLENKIVINEVQQ